MGEVGAKQDDRTERRRNIILRNHRQCTGLNVSELHTGRSGKMR